VPSSTSPSGEAPVRGLNRRGRPFAKGQGGRPKGCRNKLTLMREALAGSQARTAVELARRGNVPAAVAVVERLVGTPTTATATHYRIRTRAQLLAAEVALRRLVEAGSLPGSRAERVRRLLERRWRAYRAARHDVYTSHA
jgi:hypothetical protein